MSACMRTIIKMIKSAYFQGSLVAEPYNSDHWVAYNSYKIVKLNFYGLQRGTIFYDPGPHN